MPAEMSEHTQTVSAKEPSFDSLLNGSVWEFQVLRDFSMGIESTPTDSTLVIRCPYCFVGIEFRPMIAYKDGRFVCRDCAHTVRPGVPEYKCTCRLCLSFNG